MSRLRKHLVLQNSPVTSEEWHKIEDALLRLAQRIERSARRTDLTHDLGMLPFRCGDETALESIETLRQIRAQSLRNGCAHRCAFSRDRFSKLVESFVEGRARCVELVDDRLRQPRARDTRLNLMRLTKVLGQQIEFLEDLLDLGLDDEARPPRNNRRARNADRLRDR